MIYAKTQKMFKNTSKFFLFFLIICLLFAFFAPSKVNKEEELRSGGEYSAAAVNNDSEDISKAHIISNKITLFTQKSCSKIPFVCNGVSTVYYFCGTQLRNGLYNMYVFADKYLTDQPFEQHH